MLSWFSTSQNKPDHPMADVVEAKKLLLSLPKANPAKALDEITSWLASVKDTPGFLPENRAGVLMLLDETGQPFQAEILKQYLAEPHLQDFQGMRLWQGIHGYMKTLADAYAVCLQEYRPEEKKPALKKHMPVICSRLLRAVTEQMKLELIRYMDVEPAVWNRLFEYYSFATAYQFADTLVYPYPKQAIYTNPQRELLRAVMLYIASPDSMSPEQIEVSSRIAARMVSSFDLKEAPDPDCTYYLDFSKPCAPKPTDSNLQPTAGMHFVSAVRALPKLAEIIKQHESGFIVRERRFGDEFTPDGKLTVLHHLMLYWGKDHPHRLQERKEIHTTIEVIHGLRLVSQLVTSIKLGKIANLSEKDAAMLKEKSGVSLTDEKIDYTTETWDILDVSAGGIGGIIPKTAGDWVKVGALCGVRPTGDNPWWVGMIRRFKTDPHNKLHVGIEILAKKPLSAWVRVLGQGAEKASNWETSSGSFEYDYLPIILLPDAQNSYANATMLMETGNFVLDNIYEAMLGEHSRQLQLTGLLDEGDDYEQVSFKWLAA